MSGIKIDLVLCTLLVCALFSSSAAQDAPLQKQGASLHELVATGRARFEASSEIELRRMKAAFEEREKKRRFEQSIDEYQTNLILEFGRAIDASIRKHTVSITSDTGDLCSGLLTEAGLIVPLHKILLADSPKSLKAGDRKFQEDKSKQLFPSANFILFPSLPSDLSIQEFGSVTVPNPGAFVCTWLPDGRIVTGTVSAKQVVPPEQEPTSVRSGRVAYWKKVGFTPSPLVTELTKGFECDISIDEKDLGSPVFGLDGNLVGITSARLDTHRTVVIPIRELQRASELADK